MDSVNETQTISDDVRELKRLGYTQELSRRMSGFSNFAISMSIICILAGGITTFYQGVCSVGGASIGIGWPVACLFSLAVAATMGQLASAFPTAGGLYHWASILGGKGWGWATAWFNLFGLITVLAGINVGTYRFLLGPFGHYFGLNPDTPTGPHELTGQLIFVLAITFSQALFNHYGIRVTTLLTDFSGYLILAVAAILTVTLLICTKTFEPMRLLTFTNYSGLPEGLDPATGAPNAVWPQSGSMLWVFLLGLMLPLYTITGFDASAHTSEETVGAAHNVPKGIVRSVLVSGVFGWVMLIAMVLAIPKMDEAVKQGGNVFYWIMGEVVHPAWLMWGLYVGIGVAQYLCGLAAVTSTSRMAYAFARDGGLPFSKQFRKVSESHKTPVLSIWAVCAASVLFTLQVDMYTTITAAATIFLYISYILPTISGMIAYRRTWTEMGPWQIGWMYRPLALVCVLGGIVLLVIGMAPPNDKNIYVVGGAIVVLVIWWWTWERKRFNGPPLEIMQKQRRVEEKRAQETAV